MPFEEGVSLELSSLAFWSNADKSLAPSKAGGDWVTLWSTISTWSW